MADELPECTCRFIAAGVAMQTSGCPVHTEIVYSCDECACTDYRPKSEPQPYRDGSPGRYWPLCVCGHPAQHHNNKL